MEQGKRGIEIAAEEAIRVRPGEIRLELPIAKILGEVARISNPPMARKLLKTLSSGCTST